MRAIDDVQADTKILFIDACHSGSLLHRKGSTRAPPFLVRATPDSARGQVIIASSASNELSFESASYGGSLFSILSMHLTAALRGAADRDQDRRVTLTEAYQYTYAQTVRSTLLAGGGPQHPEFRWSLKGRHDPVLTALDRESMLTLRTDEPGTFVVFDSNERSVMAELRLSDAPSEQSIALPPGRYIVRKRAGDELRVVQVELEKGDRRVLFAHQMKRVAPIPLAHKGGDGILYFRASGGQFAAGFGPVGVLRGEVALEWEGERWLVAVGVDGAYGSYAEADVDLTSWYVGGRGGALYSWHFDGVHLRAGPIVQIPLIERHGHRTLERRLAGTVARGPRRGRSALCRARRDAHLVVERAHRGRLRGRHRERGPGLGVR